MHHWQTWTSTHPTREAGLQDITEALISHNKNNRGQLLNGSTILMILIMGIVKNGYVHKGNLSKEKVHVFYVVDY